MCAGNLPEFPACLYRPQNYNFIHASTGMDTSTENEPLCGEFSQLFVKTCEQVNLFGKNSHLRVDNLSIYDIARKSSVFLRNFEFF